MILSEDRIEVRWNQRIPELEELQVFVFFHEHRQTYHEQSYSEFLFAEVLRIFHVMYFNPLKRSLFIIVYVAD